MQLAHALKARSSDLLNKQNDFYQGLKRRSARHLALKDQSDGQSGTPPEVAASRFISDEEQDSADFLHFLFQNYTEGLESAFGTVSHSVKNHCSCEPTEQPFAHGRILQIPLQAEVNDFQAMLADPPMTRYKCDTCQDDDAHYVTTLLDFPDTAIVQFGRFTDDSDFKNNTPLRLPSGRFQVKTGATAHEYRIHAVICHHGSSIVQGHYTAVVRDEAKDDST